MESKELIAKLLELELTPESYHYEDYDENIFSSNGLETPVEVDQWGGEGEGDEYGFVIHFPTLNIYLRADGDYASYSGSDMSSAEWYKVTPQQKTITVYE